MARTKRVYFVRHGEAAGNVGGFSQTATTPLTEIGVTQAATVAQRFSNLPIEAVLASRYDRAHKTAEPIASITGLSVVTTEYFHEWEKPTSVQGAAHTSDIYQAYMATEQTHYTDPTWRFEDGENFGDIHDRIAAGVASLEERPEQQIVVVTHGRVLRFLVSYLLHKKELTAAIEQQTATSMKAVNTGITVFEFNGTSWQLITFNDIAHFAE
jgi:probable phosphoglycerate mutase